MIKEIQSYIHSATGTAYATCRSTKFGLCTQWGASEMDAIGKLKIFVEIYWGETWPEVTQNTPDNKSVEPTAIVSGFTEDHFS